MPDVLSLLGRGWGEGEFTRLLEPEGSQKDTGEKLDVGPFIDQIGIFMGEQRNVNGASVNQLVDVSTTLMISSITGLML